MIAFVEIILTLVGSLLLIALVWSIFDHRDLRKKVEADREAVVQSLANLSSRIDKVEGRIDRASRI